MGLLDALFSHQCSICRGTGKMENPGHSQYDKFGFYRGINQRIPFSVPCGACGGSGRVKRVACAYCGGSGKQRGRTVYHACNGCGGRGYTEARVD